MAAIFRDVKLVQDERKEKIVIVDPDTRFLLQRQEHDSRWHVFKMVLENGVWIKSGAYIDRDAYSNDIIEKIQLGMY